MLIVRNYALAVPFLTANALVITESMHGGAGAGYFMIARLTDVAVGSVIGLLGTMLLWRRFSTKRLPELVRNVIRLEGQFMEKLLTGQNADEHKLRVSLVRLRDAYDKAVEVSSCECGGALACHFRCSALRVLFALGASSPPSVCSVF